MRVALIALCPTDCPWGDQNTDLCQPFDRSGNIRINCYAPPIKRICCQSCERLKEWIPIDEPGKSIGHCVRARARVCVCVCVCVCVYTDSILWVKTSEYELIRLGSSRFSNKFNSTIEKGANLNLTGMKVPAVRINSVLKLNTGKYEFTWHFGLPQLRIGSSILVSRGI